MDTGFFGPDSKSWQVHREAAVMIGGARALLMHAAHPLVVAGARQTGMYVNDPWARLERTLRLNYLVTFGTRARAVATARHINLVHEQVRGIDEVTGLPYDALDPELLLWVHACLVDTSILMERLVVGRLDDAGRQAFYEESMISAELLKLPRDRMPPTLRDLDEYLSTVMRSGILRRTDGSDAVAGLIRNPPPETPQRPLWRLISFWSFGLLPPELQTLYEVRMSLAHRAALRASLLAMKSLRPLAPPGLRFIPPARSAEARTQGLREDVEEPDTIMPGGFKMPPDAQSDQGNSSH
jgi:uncharacterized protein (DUF2236 family)